MSQVSLPSQTGATESIIRSRQLSDRAEVNRIPTPRSKPSTITYIATATARSPDQIKGSQKASPWRPPAKEVRKSSIRPSSCGWLRPAARTRPDRLVGNGERPLRLAVEPVVEVPTAHRLFEPLRPVAQELGEIIAPEAEHEGIG